MVYSLDLITTFFAFGNVCDYIKENERKSYVAYYGSAYGFPTMLIHQDKFEVIESLPYKKDKLFADKVFLLMIKDTKIYFVIFRFGGVYEKDRGLVLGEEGTITFEQTLSVFYSDSLIDAKQELRTSISKMFQ